MSKRIVFTKPNTAELVNYEPDKPKYNEVQVRLSVSTISSGTERANITGSRTVAWCAGEEKEAVFPRFGGYSSAGIIEELGEGVSGFAVGDPVALNWSTHSEIVTIHTDNVVKIDDISFENAALFHIATFPLAAIRKCKLEIGESAIVMGAGILGLFALQLLKAAGAVPVIAADPDKEKRKKALECGADYALDPLDAGFDKTVKKLTNGGARIGIEVTGVGAGLEEILDCMARFGRVALLGCTRNSDFTIDYYRKVHGPGITLIGAHTHARPVYESSQGWWTQRDDMDTLKKLTQMGRINLAGLVDESHSPNEAPEIYGRLVNGSSFPIVQFDWRGFR